MEEKSKQQRCAFCHPSIFDRPNWHCVVNGWENEKVRTVTKEECEQCPKFKSKYIEYPLTINGIDNKKMDFSGLGHICAELCEVKPCGEEYKGKSYIGIYLGDLPIVIHSSFNQKSGILSNETMNNPAILVPELKKIIYGCESWWRTIKSIEDFKGITKEDIENTWYVKLLNQSNN